MKKKENNLEKNISRLVKLTADSDKPSEAFTESLIDEALQGLEQAGQGRSREGRKIDMKVTFKTLAWAAMIIVACGVIFNILMPSLSKVSERNPTLVVRQLPPSSEEAARQAATKSISDARPSKIEYTQVAKKFDAEASQPVKSVSTPSKITFTEGSRKKLESLAIPRLDAKGKAVLQAGRGGALTAGKAGRLESLARTAGEVDQLRSLGYAEAPSLSFYLLRQPEAGPGGHRMAHGGTTPPNGEDVDAMFFKNYGVNPFIDTEDDHLSTFATDVDTGSYTVCRGFLQDGHLPPNDAVRVEEFVNYFDYGYAAPQEDVFSVYAEAAPWKFGEGRKNSYLLRLALKAQQISEENRKPAILTFVIDVSGSMNRENRLGLVKKCLRMLIKQLKPQDKIGIAVYGSRGRKVMGHKGLDEKDEILAAIELLHAEGSTYAEEGIRIGYEMAEKAYKKGCINRVILCSDGVANVGQTGVDDILEVIKKKAEKGVTLSCLGFGMGNYNDVLLERLGDKGNGYYAYIDTIAEAKRLFEENLTGALQVVARDVKVQVDFSPDVVRSYRLIGYENRDVPDDKFRDDKYDGGEVGAGHSVTALYELKLWPGKSGTCATTYVRYKDADTRAVTEFKSSIATDQFNESFGESTNEFALATTVGEFAEILRKSHWAKGANLNTVLERARKLSDQFKDDADVIELVDLISKAKGLMKDVQEGETDSAEEVEIP
jgi:Ca-activated chloride channel family protein